MEAKFIVGLARISASNRLTEDIEILPNVYLSDSKTNLRALIDDHLESQMGPLEVGFLREECLLYIYSLLDIESDDVDPRYPLPRLDKLLVAIQAFLGCLWRVKDNAVNFDKGFVSVSSLHGKAVSSNGRGVRFSNARGKGLATEFKPDELMTAARYSIQTIDYHNISTRTRFVAQDQPRLSRAKYMIQAARAAVDLGQKISHYCTALESLFTTDTSELSHKISERAAWLLADDHEGRKRIYDTLKRSYAMRSKFVHGEAFKVKRTKELKQLNVNVDQLSRQLINLIYSREDLFSLFAHRKHIEPAFQLMTLGDPEWIKSTK